MSFVPTDLMAEQWTLGAMLQDETLIDDVQMVVRPEDFHTAQHQILCREIFKLRSEGKTVTAVALMDLMTKLSKDDHGLELLESLMERVPHSHGAVHHAHIVRDKSRKREMIAKFEELTRKLYQDQESASDLADEAESAIFAISDRETGDGMVEAVVAVDESIARSEARASGVSTGITTGFDDLDEILDGMQAGQLIVVAARPSVGKSAFGIGICEHIAIDRKESVALYSMEMSKREIGDRVICSRGKIDGYKFKTGVDMTPIDRRVMAEVRSVIAQQRFGVDDTASRTIGQIAASVRRRIRRNGAVFACIDYLQLIDTGASGKASRQEQVANLSRRLKILAKQAGIPIMVLSQLNRESEKREDKRPKLADLRESGAIEQDADIVLLLHRPDMYDANDDFRDRSPRKAEIIVAKNRNGSTGTIQVDFLKQFTKFANPGDHVTTNPKDAPF